MIQKWEHYDRTSTDVTDVLLLNTHTDDMVIALVKAAHMLWRLGTSPAERLFYVQRMYGYIFQEWRARELSLQFRIDVPFSSPRRHKAWKQLNSHAAWESAKQQEELQKSQLTEQLKEIMVKTSTMSTTLLTSQCLYCISDQFMMSKVTALK